MTIPTVVRINPTAPFPALVTGSGPITISKTSGIWTVGLDLTRVPGLLFLNLPDQVLTGGANVSSLSLPTGNVTVDCGLRPLQFVTNGGAFTISAPANDGSCILMVFNNASAGVVSFSGFTVGGQTGDVITTANGAKFSIHIWKVNGVAGYRVAAHQ